MPREGRVPKTSKTAATYTAFQLTRPVRGATQAPSQPVCKPCDFNPRAPRGARLVPEGIPHGQRRISTHAPREGRDCWTAYASRRRAYFNPRAPRGARHSQTSPDGRRRSISTHAPREGRDAHSRLSCGHVQNFNPRAPRGARLVKLSHGVGLAGFQPTRPARGATIRRARCGH